MIAANSTITSSSYNIILSTIAGILSTSTSGYGVEPDSVPVLDKVVVAPSEWSALFSDINKVSLHQTNTTTNLAVPASGSVITRDFVNNLQATADLLVANIDDASPAQLAANSTSSVRTTHWGYGPQGEGISHITEAIWPDEQTANWYFNLGGYLKSELGYIPGTSTGDPFGLGQELIVQDLIDSNRTQFSAPFGRTDWLATKNAVGKKRQVKATSVTDTGTFTATVFYEIFDTNSANDSIRTTVQLIPDGSLEFSADIYLDVTATVTNYSSTGSIVAVYPDFATTSTFENSNAAVIRRQVRNLTVERSLYEYSFKGGSNSAVQLIRVTNQEVNPLTDSDCTITDLQFTNNGAIPVCGATLPIIIAPGETVEIPLYWSKPTVTVAQLGTRGNTLTIVSNNTRGNIVVPINVEITVPDFDFTFSPNNLTETLTTYRDITKSFSITPVYGRVTSVDWSLSGSSNFSALDAGTSNKFIFLARYNPIDTRQGNYVATLAVTVTGRDITGRVVGLTKSTTWTVAQNIEDVNLGAWVSALGPFNSVIGASYDVINDQRYVTIGVGMGADGVPTIDQGGTNLIDLKNLGFGGDTGKPVLDVPLYRLTPAEVNSYPYCQLIKDYGVWSGRDFSANIDQNIVRTYKFTVPASGTYNWNFAVDNQGYFRILNNSSIEVVKGDLSALTESNFREGIAGTAALAAGDYTIELVFKNVGGPAALAFKLTMPLGIADGIIWSTLDPTRTFGSYRGWSEVYRFPLTSNGVTEVLNSGAYCVKDTAPVGGTGKYGDYFLDRNMFQIHHNGLGNVEIILQPLVDKTNTNIEHSTTLAQLFYAFYYFETAIPRFSQLLSLPPANGLTPYFKGFDSQGNILTSSRMVPTQAAPQSDNNLITEVLTFFLTSYLTDFIIIQSGLLTIGGGTAVSLGVKLLDLAGIDVLGTTTVTEFISAKLSSYAAVTEGGVAASGGLTLASGLTVIAGVAILVKGIENDNLAQTIVGGYVTAIGGAAIATGVGLFEAAAFVFSTGFFCFTKDTQVKLADGSIVPISKVKVGDQVVNHNGTAVNEVTFIIDSNYVGTLCSPDTNLAPFASENHPLIINGQLSSFDAEYVEENYPWLGRCEQIVAASSRIANGEPVYNLLVSGDGTYTVNGYGTTSVIGDGGSLVQKVREGTVSREEAMEILKQYHDTRQRITN